MLPLVLWALLSADHTPTSVMAQGATDFSISHIEYVQVVQRWDNSVKAAIAATKVISRAPPKGFPASFLTRFDVESQRTEEVIHLSSK